MILQRFCCASRWRLPFFTSIGDRFGWFGPPGAANVSWGTFARFTGYVAILNWYLPHSVIPALAWIDTVLEFLLGCALLAGLWLRSAAIVSALLLLAFGITMSIRLGIGAPLAYSVFTASAAAFLLASMPRSAWSLKRFFRPSSARR